MPEGLPERSSPLPTPFRPFPRRQFKQWEGAIARSLCSMADASPQFTQQAQQWLLKLYAVLVYHQRLGITEDLETWADVQTCVETLGDRFGVIPQPWYDVAAFPSDALLHRLRQGLRGMVPLPLDWLGHLYERSPYGMAQPNELPKSLRKTSGTYYTPGVMVDGILRQTLAAQLQHSTAIAQQPPTVIDIACGSGIFLVAALQHLQQWSSQALPKGELPPVDPSFEQQLELVQRHIHGLDLDPQGVAIARLSLFLAILSPKLRLPQNYPAGAVLQTQLIVGNALFPLPNAPPWLHRNSGFSVVVGNPPYIPAVEMRRSYPDWRLRCSEQYRTATGNWDIFCVFIERALDLTQMGGWLSLVVPNKLLSADYAAVARSLLSRYRLHHIQDYAQIDLFAAAVYPIVFVLEKLAAPDPPVPVPYCQLRSLQALQTDLPQPTHLLTLSLGSSQWQITHHPEQQRLLHQMERHGQPLGAIATVQGAATVAEAYRLTPLIQSTPYLPLPPKVLRIVNSGTIDRYHLRWHQPLHYLGQRYPYPHLAPQHWDTLPAKRLHQAQCPKIIVAGLTQRIEAIADLEGTLLAAKSTSIILAASTDWLLYCLGILNSRVLDWYVQTHFSGNRLRGGYMRIGPPQLRQLPIPPWSDRAPALVAAVRTLLAAPSQPSPQFDACDRQIDALVAELYGLTMQEVALLDIAPI